MMMKLNAYVHQLELEGYEVADMKNKFSELTNTGITRFYENEGFILCELMDLIEETLNEKDYAYTVDEIKNEAYLEIVKIK
jgi:ferritin